jgi:hypothetical protein
LNFFANVSPVQKSAIPWGWHNRKTDHGLIAIDHPGTIRMPEVHKFFDWKQFIVEDMAYGRDFGTRNMKSVFTTAARFMSWEELLIKTPDLSPITRGFLEWNSRLTAAWDGKLKWFMIGDEVAYARGLLINPDWFREWIKPEHKKLIDSAHAWGMRVIFKSDGDLWDVLDDYVELGVSVLYYQNVGRMKNLCDIPEVVFNSWKGRLWNGMLCVENDDACSNAGILTKEGVTK